MPARAAATDIGTRDIEEIMDTRLLAWARAVKRRQRAKLPVLWLFTDAQRLPNPLPAIAQLPKFHAGVVFRHDATVDRASLAKRVAALCQARHIPLVVAGDARLAAALRAGVHLRGGFWPGRVRTRFLVTSSAHNIPELRRAERAGAQIIFLSPAFKSPSHPGQPVLGATNWANIAQKADKSKVYILGGITGKNVGKIPYFCAGVGAISALNP
jgi:thiamine-phosphate pyrophosphorylase